MNRLRTLLMLLMLLLPAATMAAGIDHGAWDALLHAHVRVLDGGKTSQLDYAGMKRDRAALDAYLHALALVSSADFDAWPTALQLAFLINAYNAATVQLVLTRYPDLDSIKDLGSFFQSPWKQRFVMLLGSERTLDEIEHTLIRGSGRYNDPRVHFALNCASIGCPALRAEAFAGERLELQLEDGAVLFLSDRSRNYLAGDVLHVSSIFKWYREDFAKGWRGAQSLEQFLGLYAPALGLDDVRRKALLAGAVGTEFLEYDWRLNKKP